MRVIIDENVPHPLLRYLAHHTVTSVQREGWSGNKNGKLLQLIEGRFDEFILGDKNFQYQQNLSGHQIAIVELSTIRWTVLRTLIPAVVRAVDHAHPGTYVATQP